jgi:hypothetical protein
MESGTVAMGSAHCGSQASPARISQPNWPFIPGVGAGESPGLCRVAMAGQIPATTGDKVQRGGFGEQAGGAADQIWGGGEEGAHRRGLSMMEGIGGGGRTPASQSGGHRRRRNGRRGTPWWRGARGGVEGVRE